MIRLLRESSYRVLGSAEDLQNVVLEQLQLIARDAKQHLSLLYHPRPQVKGERRRHLQEDALQAYLYCRLRDRLPAVLGEKGLKIAPTVDRETLAARDKRNDLKIQAPSTEGRLLTVIVEIKWSDNDQVSTSQVEQLGRDYLLQNGLTHGIYLVGWSGETGPWKKQALGSAPQPTSCPRAWEQALEEQAGLFRKEHPELAIRPLVMDLAW